MKLRTLAMTVLIPALAAPSCGYPSLNKGETEAETMPPGTSGGLEPQDLDVRTTCEVVGAGDVSKMKIYRHAGPATELRLSVFDLPMTCADEVKARATWSAGKTPGLTLAVSGVGYKHCLCTFDFEPFAINVPKSFQSDLNATAFTIVRGDASTPVALRQTTVGDLPFFVQ